MIAIFTGNKMHNQQLYKVLTIAGFDGSGGAGIQADLKTFSALGCFATSALTALPVQNTMGVKSVYEIETVCLEEQIKTILEDISMNAIKIGMLHRQEIIESVATILRHYKATNIVLDPVMVAKSGDRLLKPQAILSMKKQLLPITTVLTPNLIEASELLGRNIQDKAQMERAALDLIQMGPQAVVVKGGHLKGDCDDCLCLNTPTPEIYWFSSQRIQTRNTHGTGCTFSAAITAFLARGFTISNSVKQAKEYLTQAIDAGKQLKIGRGNGPVHHFYHLWNNLLHDRN
jgi:hydroxymethylpyrimidine/phosphomethylpyrimidine kinase